MKLIYLSAISIIFLYWAVTIYCLIFAFSVGMGLLLFALSIIGGLWQFARKMSVKRKEKYSFSDRKYTLSIDEKGHLKVWKNFEYEYQNRRKNGTIQKQLRDNNFI